MSDGTYEIFTNHNEQIGDYNVYASGMDGKNITSTITSLPEELTIDPVVEIQETEVYNSTGPVEINTMHVKGDGTNGGTLDINCWGESIIITNGKVEKGGKLRLNPITLDLSGTPVALDILDSCTDLKSSGKVIEILSAPAIT